MAVRHRVRFLGLVLLCGSVSIPGSVGSKLFAQQTPLPLPTPIPTSPAMPTHSPPGIPFNSPGVRPDERPLPINLATALGLANAQPWDILAAPERVRIASAQLQQSNVLWLPSLYTGGIYQTNAGSTQSANGTISSPSTR